jgi:small neutral amino acid transporter SnatA (MarC family)
VTFVVLLVAFVSCVNPARVHCALPAPGTRGARVAVTAVGAAVTLVVVAAVAGLAHALLDALDIDEASARIAAGLVLLIAGGRDLLTGPPAAEPALPGWRAALVPVAVPLLLTPELVVLAVAAGADRGVAVTVGAALLAVGAVVGAALAPRDLSPAAARVRDVTARLTAVVLVVVAVDLTIDGILSV